MCFSNSCTLIFIQIILRCVKDYSTVLYYYYATIINEFLFAYLGTDNGDTGADLPQRSELPLFDAQELRAFTRDNSGMSGGVVQDRLSKRCSRPQCAYDNSILNPNTVGQ